MPRSPHPPPPQAGWGGAPSRAASHESILLCLAAALPGASAPGARVRTKDPQHLAHRCALSSERGRGTAEGRARATSAGGEGAQRGACQRTLLGCVRGGDAAGARAAPARDSSFGPELQGASEDSAEPPTAPFPTPPPCLAPAHSPTPPALRTNATPETTSRCPGTSPPRPLFPSAKTLRTRHPHPLAKRYPANTPSGGSLFAFPCSGCGCVGVADTLGRPSRCP